MISKHRTNQLRIIAGQWRGRKIQFPALDGLRPSGDRFRETLFNRLSPQIEGQCCLDLFAGSGALGFEALSRGAAYVQMVDRHAAVIRQLQATAAALQTEAADIMHGVVPQCLSEQPARRFDIVFLDPPFKQQLVAKCSQWLQNHGYLAENARIYIETELPIGELCLPECWQLLYNKQSGRVCYYLFKRM